MKLKLNIIRLWVFACVVYVIAIFLGFVGMYVESIPFILLYLLLLILTRWGINPRSFI